VPTDAPAAFLSYCREDSEFALRLAADLKAAGANVWIDQLDIEAGLPWDTQVGDALARCPRLIVVLSPVSIKSDNVGDEVGYALSKQKRIIPVLYRDCETPFRLARLQHIDFRTDYAHALPQLVKALSAAQAAEATEQPQPTEPEAPRRLVGAISTLISKLPLWARIAVSAAALLIVALISYAVWHWRLTQTPTEAQKQPAGIFNAPASPPANQPRGQPAAGKTKPVVPTGPPISGWAVSANGTVLHTENGGATWQQQSSNAGFSAKSVTFITAQVGWMVGSRGKILHTQDSGRTWQPQTSSTTSDLNFVTAISPQSAWAVGQSGTILHTEDAGLTWQPQKSHAKGDLGSITLVTPQSAWAVGGPPPWTRGDPPIESTILHTEDGGRTWQRQKSGTPEGLSSASFVTPQSGWAAGGNAILHTEDAGKTWQWQNSGIEQLLLGIAFTTPQSGWAIGWFGAILHTEDGGASWHTQTSAGAYLNFLVFITPQSGWVLGDGGTILHTEDGGRIWTKQSTGTREPFVSAAFLKPQ